MNASRLNQQAAFFAPAAVMTAWAVVMLHTFATGHLNRLLSPIFRSYVVVAAIVLIALSLVYLLLYQPVMQDAPVTSPRNFARQLGRWLMLLLPVLAAAVLSPDALSSTAEKNRASGPSASYAMPSSGDSDAVKQALAAAPDQPVPMEVTDLITLSHSADQAAKFEGHKIRVVGLYAGGATPKLVRWIMWCCAADAQPASAQLVGGPTNFKDEEWVEVVGTAQFPTVLGNAVPQIQVESIKPTTEPDEPYLSP